MKQFWTFIRTRGVSDHYPESNSLTSLINLLAFLTATVALIVFITFLFVIEDSVYLGVTLGVAILFYLILFFHHFQLHRLARIYISTVVTQWYGIALLILGGSFGQTVSAAAGIFITFILFRDQKRLRNLLLLSNLICFLIPALYVSFNGPLFGEVRDYPLDEVLVFFLCLGWFFIVVATYEEMNRKTLTQKEEAIRNKEKEVEELIYMASHDLKAPSNKILGLMHVLKEALKDKDEELAANTISYLDSTALRINEMVLDILQVSKFREPERADLKEVNLETELQKALFNLEPYLNEQHARVEAAPLPTLKIREGDFSILFQNLIQNGVKYNQSDIPVVKITNRQSEGFQEIAICDNGIGIEAKYHATIFDMFQRVPASNEVEGTGIGLGICKKIADLYGAEINVESELGKYTCFTIRFPLREAPSPYELVIEPIRNLFK